MPATFQMPTAQSWSNPWPMYRALRDHDPVHHVVHPDRPGEDSACYVLSRHADIWSAACDPETFSSGLAPAVNYGELKLPGFQDNPPTAGQEPQAYREFRKLVSRGFTPGQVETSEPKVREFVVERIERLRANGGGDIVAELFKPLPSMVVADFLGVPEEDRSYFYDWTEPIIAANLAESSEGLNTAAGAFTAMMGYSTELIKLRRLVPGDDVISKLIAEGMGSDADIAGMLSLLAFVFALVASGIDTTVGMLAGSTQLLHQRPDQRKLLVENPGLIPNSIDELLRLTSPVQLKGRIVTRGVTIGGTTVPEGSQVLLLYGSANRDERQYGPDAGELNVHRQPRNILTFSHGANRCLGAAVARMQSRVTLTEILARCPDFAVDESGIVWANSSHVRRPLSVPFRVS
ncbi:cytochrome P450 130 [Mycobacterium bohemicum DSM 44277]|uniref:Cytochrome n=2 Tax=Mycobacterium bohemicum TaxID=56425 RepID=A0A1X1R0W0_MYCBE|nr:cytochrome P450 [Mycobacterium bohemicum]MCV6969367.1 cytochrome P450 [Mycobacterium bohemicum]ORU97613.1 cytochrome [Mycobacterium bohemicum]CPR13222.1 cytochrome P450 130 [Mycobacterium bohemicum DSM 44277]